MNEPVLRIAVAPGWRTRLGDFIESPRIQRLIVTLIVVNAGVLGLETFPALMAGAAPLLRSLDASLLAVFVLELLLKLVAQGLRFFRSAWNVFDFLVIGIALLPATAGLSVLRALRVLRVLRLVSAVPKMRFVVESLVRSLPGIGSIGLLLGIFFYVFSVMATKLFAAQFPQWFGSLFGSMFSLFQIMTLEGWADIAREVMVVYPWSWLFFLGFILLATFTVLNLFIAVIVNAMQEPAMGGPERPAATAAGPESPQEGVFRQELAALRSEIAALRRELSAGRPGSPDRIPPPS